MYEILGAGSGPLASVASSRPLSRGLPWMEAEMKSWIGTRSALVAALVFVSTSWIAAVPEPIRAEIAASSGHDAKRIILAQYNPCPNGRCR